MNCRQLSICLVVVAACFSGVLMAQTDRVSVRVVPAPNQVVETRMTTEMTLETSPIASQGSAPFSAKVVQMMTAVATMDVGVPGLDGRMNARYRFTTLTSQMTMNGQPVQVGPSLESLMSQSFAIKFDDQGRIVEVEPPGNAAVSSTTLKTVLTRAFASVPNLSLAVGESGTVPATLSLPLPTGGSMNSTSNTTYTLLSVSEDNAQRIAHFSTETTGDINQPNAAGTPFAMQGTIKGRGMMDVNLDRGFVRASQSDASFDFQMQPRESSSVSIPPMRMRGTMKMTSESF
jgi:hypothetical protein